MGSSGYERSQRRRTSAGSSTERIVFYVDDVTGESAPEVLRFRDPSERSAMVYHLTCPNAGLYPSALGELPPRSNSICSQTDRPRRSRNSSDSEHSGSRRASVHSSRSRTNSYSRSTPLGDGRRSSVCRKGTARRASTAACGVAGTGGRRKDSVRPSTRVEIRESKGQIVVKTALEEEQARRHRRVTAIVVGTFFFLLVASILVVVVTLTHSSFHVPPVNSMELPEHRSQRNRHRQSFDEALRKENEELLNSLSQDTSLPGNATAPP